jgi:hypothetical protein
MCVVETEAQDASQQLVGWAELQGPETVSGFATLRHRPAPDRDSEVMLLFDRCGGSGYVLPYDNTAGLQTGVAIANRSAAADADLELVFRDPSGAVFFEDSLSVRVRGHVSFNLGEKYPDVAGRRGALEIRNRSADGIGVLGLRFNPSGSIAALPVIAK